MRLRREKRQRLLDGGVAAYPADLSRTHTLSEVRKQWGHLGIGEETYDEVTIGGRVIFARNTGKLCFATLQDGFTLTENGERLQVMLSLVEVGETALDAWKAVVDLGDFVWLRGRVIASKRGELSVLAAEWRMASKALRPLPVLHKDLSEESRVRQRHNDLIARVAAREMVRLRAAITSALRKTCERWGFIEVETPVLQTIHGGAAARPFNTHLNAFNLPMSLRIALELYLKRVMSGGADRVYEIGRVFRNEGVDSSHSPEFTMLEAYQSWGDQFTIAQFTKELLLDAADVVGSRQITRPDAQVIDLNGEWRWLPMYEGLSEALGFEVDVNTEYAVLSAAATKRGLTYDPKWGADRLAKGLFDDLVEPTLLQPTYVCDYPAVIQPLARRHRSKPGLIEAWDLIIGGMERGTGYTELIDPVIQREILSAQSLQAAAGDPEAMQLDEEFLTALEQGCPPLGGMGLGVDRLVMLFSNAGIRETILFPLLRPQG
ncbi:MAG: lysine--tRNA ligase [Propionibacteriaceae bacterium]|nr:lysine--tRNA ligase [Propionibacteriaceae bacterium]